MKFSELFITLSFKCFKTCVFSSSSTKDAWQNYPRTLLSLVDPHARTSFNDVQRSPVEGYTHDKIVPYGTTFIGSMGPRISSGATSDKHSSHQFTGQSVMAQREDGRRRIAVRILRASSQTTATSRDHRHFLNQEELNNCRTEMSPTGSAATLGEMETPRASSTHLPYQSASTAPARTPIRQDMETDERVVSSHLEHSQVTVEPAIHVARFRVHLRHYRQRCEGDRRSIAKGCVGINTGSRCRVWTH